MRRACSRQQPVEPRRRGSGYTEVAELLNLRTGRLSPFSVTCFPHSACSPQAIGFRWIEYVRVCTAGCHSPLFFQNVRTDKFRSDPTNATTVPDLDSPGLARRLCPPLRTVRAPANDGGGWDPITFDGRFAITDTPGKLGATLMRCGTRLHRAIGSNPIASAQAVIWWTSPTRKDGLLLPSLQRITIVLPPALASANVTLTPHTLFAVAAGGKPVDGAVASRIVTEAHAIVRGPRHAAVTPSGRRSIFAKRWKCGNLSTSGVLASSRWTAPRAAPSRWNATCGS